MFFCIEGLRAALTPKGGPPRTRTKSGTYTQPYRDSSPLGVRGEQGLMYPLLCGKADNGNDHFLG
jgi:hypothetical protein